MNEYLFTKISFMAGRIASEVEIETNNILLLADYRFRTIPEADLARASKVLRETADFIDKKIAAIGAKRESVA